MRRRLGLILYGVALRLHPELREMQETTALLMARHVAAQVQRAQQLGATLARAQYQANVGRIARDN